MLDKYLTIRRFLSVCLFPTKNCLQFESREGVGDWDGVSAVETISSSVAQLVSHSVSKDDLELLSDPISSHRFWHVPSLVYMVLGSNSGLYA